MIYLISNKFGGDGAKGLWGTKRSAATQKS
jgi:hypothetical protein